jgi:hypothetical protein
MLSEHQTESPTDATRKKKHLGLCAIRRRTDVTNRLLILLSRRDALRTTICVVGAEQEPNTGA